MRQDEFVLRVKISHRFGDVLGLQVTCAFQTIDLPLLQKASCIQLLPRAQLLSQLSVQTNVVHIHLDSREYAACVQTVLTKLESKVPERSPRSSSFKQDIQSTKPQMPFLVPGAVDGEPQAAS